MANLMVVFKFVFRHPKLPVEGNENVIFTTMHTQKIVFRTDFFRNDVKVILYVFKHAESNGDVQICV